MQDIELILSNTIDVISVDNNYMVINPQTSMNQVLIKSPSGYIEPDEIHVSHHATHGVQHSVSKESDKNVLSVIFPEGSYVLKNAQIFVTATGSYENEDYSVSGTIRYISIIKEETCRLKPSVDIIKIDNSFNYSPPYIDVKIQRTFDNISKEFNTYKDYCIKYSYSDNPKYELPFVPQQYINLYKELNHEDGVSHPEYLIFRLYENKDSHIPVHIINIPIEQTAYDLIKSFKLESTNESDMVITDSDYIVVDDTTLSTTISFTDGYTYGTILNTDNYPVNIEIDTLNADEEILLENIIISADIDDSDMLVLGVSCKQNTQIPKRITITVNVSGYYLQNPNILKGACTFTINANPCATAIYELLPNANAIRVNKDEVKDPLIIGVEKYRWISNRREKTDYGFILYSLDASEPYLYEHPIDVDDVENNVLFEYYAPDMSLLAREEVYVVYDGSNAAQDPGYDEVISHNKYYLGWDHSDAENIVPAYTEEWSKDMYPDSSHYNNEHPYLWSYERTVYRNTVSGEERVIQSIPIVVNRYVAGLSEINEYYYSVPKIHMNSEIGYKLLDDGTYRVLINNIDTDDIWDDTLTEQTTISPDRPKLYKIVVTRESESTRDKVAGPMLISSIAASDIYWLNLDELVASKASVTDTPEQIS